MTTSAQAILQAKAIVTAAVPGATFYDQEAKLMLGVWQVRLEIVESTTDDSPGTGLRNLSAVVVEIVNV